MSGWLRRVRWRWVIAGVGAAVVVLIGTAVVLFAVRERPGAKPVGEAVEEFRATTVPEGSGRGVGPTPGVYRADGEGSASLSLPPTSQRDGAPMPVTVETIDEGCWRVRIDYNEAHWQNWNYCIEGDVVIERGGATHQRWDFGPLTVENLSEFTCDPPPVVVDPDAGEGTSWQHSCTGFNSEIAGTTDSRGPHTFVGREQLVVGGDLVVARRYRHERAVSGAQQGRTTFDVWFEVESHLPVRMERQIRLDSDSPVGAITYTEEGWWQLAALNPER
jgi:hypothetical protein